MFKAIVEWFHNGMHPFDLDGILVLMGSGGIMWRLFWRKG